MLRVAKLNVKKDEPKCEAEIQETEDLEFGALQEGGEEEECEQDEEEAEGWTS